jgi:hypothetical protein
MVFTITDLDSIIQLKLEILESIINPEMYYDCMNQIFDKINNNRENKNELKGIISELENLSKKHQRWDNFDTEVIKTKNKNYNSLLESISKYKYENSKINEKKRVRLILDGFTVSLTIKINSKSKIFRIENPNHESHPILYLFLKNTLKIFTSKFEINNKRIINF